MLKGKNAVVTGANGGIGRAILKSFAMNGANVWACVRKPDENFLNYVGGLTREYHSEITPVSFDLTNSDEMKEAIKTIVKSKKNIDALVNNAGIAQYNSFSMLATNTLKQLFEVNYFAPLQFTQLLSRRMKKGASIVFLSSVSGLDAISGNTAYGGSKAAVSHTTRVLAREMAVQGIRVNAVAPGMVDTDMKFKAEPDAWEQLISQTYLKRVAKPEEIANVVSFLVSDLASYITGQVIRVDGGMN